MRRNLDAILTRFPGLYRHDLLKFHMEKLGWDEVEASKRAHMAPFSLRRILSGKATGGKTIWPVAQALGVDWAMLHDLELKRSKFHLARAERGGSDR